MYVVCLQLELGVLFALCSHIVVFAGVLQTALKLRKSKYFVLAVSATTSLKISV